MSDSSSSSNDQALTAIGFGANYNHNMGPAKEKLYFYRDENADNQEQFVRGYELSEDDKSIPWNTEDDPLIQIDTTASSTLFLTKQGKIYNCGTMHGNVYESLTRTIIQLPLKCVEVAAGRHFGLARMEGGLAVCSWGAGHFGQLGLGSDSAPYVSQPSVIEALLPHVVGAPIAGITAGYWHAMAVTQSGHLYSWGCNRNSQCGFKPTKDPPTLCAPQLVRFDLSAIPKIEKIAAGRSHSVALDEEGAVYCWGACQYGQCGIQTRRRGGVAPPKYVESLEKVQVVEISAGDSHTLVLTSGGRVFAWGSGFEGQLGSGMIVQMNPKPKLVGDLDFVAIEAGREWKTQQKQKTSLDTSTNSPDTSPILSSVPRIVSVLATGNSSYVRSSSGHVYVWGCNDVGNLGIPKPDSASLVFAEPGVVPPKTSTLRQFHTYSFDSSHNIALPQRLDCLSHMNITALAASPTFLWCLGTKRSEADPKTLVGRTLYEVQEGKRQKSLRHPKFTRKSDSSATSDRTPSPIAPMDPPEMKDGTEVGGENPKAIREVGTVSFEDGSTSRHSRGFANSSQENLIAETTNKDTPSNSSVGGMPPKSPARRRFSIPKAIGKMVRRASLNNSPFRSDNGDDSERKARKGFF